MSKDIKNFPAFTKDGQTKLLEIKLYQNQDRRFILFVNHKEHYYIFDLEQLTVRIHAYFKLDSGFTPQVDCFNNIIMVKANEFHKIIDIDNIFRQKIK